MRNTVFAVAALLAALVLPGASARPPAGVQKNSHRPPIRSNPEALASPTALEQFSFLRSEPRTSVRADVPRKWIVPPAGNRYTKSENALESPASEPSRKGAVSGQFLTGSSRSRLGNRTVPTPLKGNVPDKEEISQGLLSNETDGSLAAGNNDLCENQEPIEGEASFAFDTRAATTDGPEHAACTFVMESQIEKDVWFCWTAPSEPCEGDFVASTCGGTLLDSKVAIYDGCACPPTDANLLSCSDDDCGLQTRTPFNPVPGQQYLIRLGEFPGGNLTGGTGTLRLQCVPPQPCQQQGSECQVRALTTVLNSNGTDFSVAEDFTPAQTGQVTTACWWGTYVDPNGDPCQSFAVDSFELNYYRGTDGVPDELVASFSQAAGTLTVDGPAETGLTLLSGSLPEFAYSATHAPVELTAGECYYVEIKNPIEGCSWFWEESIAANGRAFQDGVYGSTPGLDARDGITSDLAFCLDVPLGDPVACQPPPPPNDDCANASDVNTEGPIFFENAAATLDGPDHTACLAAGRSQIDHDEWICWTSPCNGEIVVRTCDETDVDTKIAVYEGCGCPPTDETLLTCNDDFCATQAGFQAMVIFDAIKGNQYMIRLGTFPFLPGGPGLIEILCGAPSNPACPTAGGCCLGASLADPRTGCGSQSCCERVCACDPFCCEVNWDESCAGQGIFETGCGAENLCGCSGQCGAAEAGSCCQGNGTPACDDDACCEAVCACDQFCCNMEWDDLCAGEGAEPGCGAALLCSDLCTPTCPEGVIDWVTPDPFVVDARRPHDRFDQTLTEGITSVVVTAPTGAEAECFTLCETQVSPTANTIAQVVENAGTYTLTLQRPITKGSVTTITYTDNGGAATTAEFVSHPGNVNDDDAADSADVLDFAGALEGSVTLPWGLFSEDIDRTGLFSPIDLLELVNLLNGAEAFDAWNNTAKPQAAPTCPVGT